MDTKLVFVLAMVFLFFDLLLRVAGLELGSIFGRLSGALFVVGLILYAVRREKKEEVNG